MAIKKTDSGVTNIAGHGTTYHGNLVVGADGINGRICSEMWRIAHSLDLVTTHDKHRLQCQTYFDIRWSKLAFIPSK